MSIKKSLEKYFQESASVISKLSEHCGDAVEESARLIAQSFRNGGKLLLCGNGGSAADCQHMAAEFVSRLTK